MSEGKETNLLAVLKESGEILFAYCDRHNFYTLYKPYGEKVLYLAICDKSLYIVGVDRVEVPKEFFDYRSLRFFRPVEQGGVITFAGLLTRSDGVYKFSFNEAGRVAFEKADKTFQAANANCNLISQLQGIKITHGVQRGEKYYFTGIDEEPENGDHPVYGVVDLTSGKLETVYCLYSDFGEIETSAITIDPYEQTVYVVGKICTVNEQQKVVDQIPYIEKFFYRG